MERVGRDAGDSLNAGLRIGVGQALSSLTGQFGSFGNVAGSVLEGLPIKAAAAAAGIGAIALGAIEAGKALYNLGKQWDDISDSITVKTGKTGEDLENLTKIVGDVGSTTAASLGSIGHIVEQISQSMPDLAQNNAAVRQMASNLAYLDANGQSVNVRELGMAFNAFGVDAGHSIQALDDLNRASQATGIPLDQLIQTIRVGAPQFRQFGLDMGQATGMLASFAQAGVGPEIAVTGLRIALKNVGGEGKDAAANLAAAVTQIKALHDAQQEGAAQQKAQDIFGTKNAAAFLQVIENGTLNVQNLNKALSDTGLSIAEQQGATDDWAQSLEKIKNTVSVGLKPLADTVFGSINAQLQAMAGNFGLASDKANDLASAMASAASVPITPDSALGRMLTPGGLPGGLTPGVAGPLGGAAAGGYQPPGSGLYGPGGALAPSWGSHQISPRGGSSAGGSSSAAAAQVPYGELPALAAGVPLTPEVYSAQTSLWDANHALAEKQARVQQIQADNTAKAEDLIAAQNDVDKAKRDQHEAELRFAQTQQNALEKQYKQLDKAATDLGQIGARLDSDFGISKGLGGIVENITKMVANLAAAPVIGALAGGQMGLGFKPGEAGSGLTGILAGSGAFGSQYVAQPSLFGGQGGGGYGPAAMGPAALMPGGGPAGYTSGGASYGLPSGTDTGGYGTGTSKTFPAWVMQVADAFRLKPSTYSGHQESDRHEAGYAPNPLHQNRGIDWSGSPVNMQRFADYLKTVPGMEQVIWNGAGMGTGDTVEIAGGRSQPGYFADDLPAHGDHVHTRQSSSIPLPGMVAGSPGQGYPLPWNLGGPGGAGMPGAPGAVGASAGTLIGGLAPRPGTGKGGLGPSGGGLLGAALGAASSAAGLAASGAAMGMDGGAGGAAASAAMQIGIQEINRAIQFGGQAYGIAASGLIETFLPFGASELAQNNWLTRIVGGIVGAAPVLPNLAGGSGKKTPEGLTPEQAAQYQGQQGLKPEDVAGDPNKAKQPGVGGSAGTNVTNNLTVNNSRATEDGTGRDLTYHLGAMASAPGM